MKGIQAILANMQNALTRCKLIQMFARKMGIVLHQACATANQVISEQCVTSCHATALQPIVLQFALPTENVFCHKFVNVSTSFLATATRALALVLVLIRLPFVVDMAAVQLQIDARANQDLKEPIVKPLHAH